jgi:quinol monooxygenase YgiN
MSEPTAPEIGGAFGLVVRFTVRPGSERAFDELVATTVAEIQRHEPGTLLYGVHTVEGEPQTRIFYELYRDRDAFMAHEDQPHTRHFLAQREQLLDAVAVDWVSPTVFAGLGEGPP